MDAPEIRYARGTDGRSIAYARLGKGPLLVDATVFGIGLQDRWEIREMRDWTLALAATHTVVMYDERGFGLSERAAADQSQEGRLQDLEAVVDAVGADRVDVFAAYRGAIPAIAYAAAHPERVRRLALWSAFARGADVMHDRRLGTFQHLAAADPEVYSEATIRWVMGSVATALIPRFTEAFVKDARTEAGASVRAAFLTWDVTNLLGTVTAPTLVLHRADLQIVPVSLGRELAAEIPNARMMIVPGDSIMPYLPAHEPVLSAVDEFLSPGPQDSTSDQALHGSFRTILFTDVVASTPLLTQLKDERMRAIMRDHDAVLQAAVDEHDGRVIKKIGDAFMAVFAVPSAAVECAIAMQRGIRVQFAESDVPIRLRIGINAGEPIVEDDDLHGASVVIAKRLESAAATDGILISDGVKQLLAGKDFDFSDKGELNLKGFDEPVRAWSVAWGATA